ncbi:MAG: hypothetical protein AB1410_10910 [Acidobacteriota bacterium]
MIKKFLMGLLVVVFALSLFLAVLPVGVSGATCTSGDGKKTCTGPCCEAGSTWCVASDCPKVAN